MAAGSINDGRVRWLCVYAAQRWLCADANLHGILFLNNRYAFVSVEGLLQKERADGWHGNTGIGRKFFHGYKLVFCFVMLLAYFGNKLPGRSFPTAGNIHNIFCINHYAVWDRLLHNHAQRVRLLV